MTRSGKYNARKTVVDGITFDSAMEARRYVELKLMVSVGQIENLKLQPTFLLQKASRDFEGHTIRAITYRADFEYREWTGSTQGIRSRTVVEDVKGHKTEVYKLKRKLFLFKYPEIVFREVQA